MMAATRRVLRGIAFDMDGTLTGQISVTYDFIGMPACVRFSVHAVRSSDPSGARLARQLAAARTCANPFSKKIWSRSMLLMRCEPSCVQIQELPDATSSCSNVV